MKAWRLTATVAVAMVLGACGSSGSTPKTSDDATEAGGCPDEDPFCEEAANKGKGGGSDADDDSDSSGSGSTGESGATTGTSPFGGGASPSSPKVKQFELVLAVSRPAPPATAPKDPKAAKTPPPPAKPAKPVPGKVVLHPLGMAFGIGSEQIAKIYDRAFDKAYLELYKTTPIGPQTEALDNELAEKKAQLRRSLLEFGSLPSGMDNTALKGEYSYNNDESMSRLDLENGIVRHFFFFGDRLWKIYDEHQLGAGKPLGTSFDSAVAYVEEKLAVKAKRLPADFGAGRNFDTAEWTDGTTLLRLANRDPVVGVIFIDESIEKKLPTLRRNRKSDPTAVDATVRSVTTPAAPPPDTKKKK
ncbi:MAG: hypothetical protein JW751_10290 [Polyangiaceae bacterium]|nr:hypothetical protein [Polyangiaceae bacterium]